MKIKPPQEGAMGTVPEHMRTPEEAFWIEQGAIDKWIDALEAGEPPPSVPITGEWSTVEEVAARHRCSSKTIRARIYDGSLAAVKHGAGKQARYRVHRDAEEAWIKSKGEHKRATAARKAQAGSTFKALVQK